MKSHSPWGHPSLSAALWIRAFLSHPLCEEALSSCSFSWLLLDHFLCCLLQSEALWLDHPGSASIPVPPSQLSETLEPGSPSVSPPPDLPSLGQLQSTWAVHPTLWPLRPLTPAFALTFSPPHPSLTSLATFWKFLSPGTASSPQ